MRRSSTAASLTEPVGRSPRSRPSAIEFYRALQECHDIGSCAALFKSFVAAYNVDVFACGEVDIDNKGLTVFHIIEWPEKFRKLYHAANMVERDPIVEGLRYFREPFTWTDMRRQRMLNKGEIETLRIVGQHGWRDGLVVPVARECLLARIRSFGPMLPRF
jgi:Autoinducer binding domain